MGLLYAGVGQTEPAREHYEKAALTFDRKGDHYQAGLTRFNIAMMYEEIARKETTPSRRRDLLHRAQAYAQATLRDLQHYQGRAADKEAKAQRLIDRIAQAIAKLPA